MTTASDPTARLHGMQPSEALLAGMQQPLLRVRQACSPMQEHLDDWMGGKLRVAAIACRRCVLSSDPYSPVIEVKETL